LKYTKDPDFIGKRPESKKEEGFWKWLLELFTKWF
jgi:hypothetical protein